MGKPSRASFHFRRQTATPRAGTGVITSPTGSVLTPERCEALAGELRELAESLNDTAEALCALGAAGGEESAPGKVRTQAYAAIYGLSDVINHAPAVLTRALGG